MGEKVDGERAPGQQLVIRIDGELRQALTGRAASEQIGRRKLSRLYRALLWAGLTGTSLEAIAKALTELERVRNHLSRIGSNLNQVARRLNTEDELKERELYEAIKDLRPQFDRCQKLVTELQDGLIRRIP